MQYINRMIYKITNIMSSEKPSTKPSKYSIEKTETEIDFQPFNITYNGEKIKYFQTNLPFDEDYLKRDVIGKWNPDWIGVGYKYTTKSHFYKYGNTKRLTKGFLRNYKRYVENNGREKRKKEDKIKVEITTNTYVAKHDKSEHVLTYFSFNGHKFRDDTEIQKCLEFIDLAERKAAILTSEIWDKYSDFRSDTHSFSGDAGCFPYTYYKFPFIFHPLYYTQFPFICMYKFSTDLTYNYKTRGIILVFRNKKEYHGYIEHVKKGILSKGKKLFGKNKEIREKYMANSLDMLDKGRIDYPISEETVYHMMDGGKMQPYLPIVSHRCLWCGKEISSKEHIPGRNGHFCKPKTPGRSSSCNVSDSTFNAELKEHLRKADMTYVLGKYAEYVASHEKMKGFYEYSPESVDELVDEGCDITIKNMLFYYQSGQIPHRLFAAWLRGPRLCKFCGKEIPHDKPFTICYCSDECRTEGRNRSKRITWHKNKDKYTKKE